MKECPKCNAKHDKNGKFCSISCANSRAWSDEDKKIKSIAGKKSDKVKIANRSKSKEVYEKMIETKKKIHIQKIMTSEYSDLSFESLRFRIIYEQNSCCNNCGLKEWMGVEIPLELEHIDGNNKNNVRDNLEMLCPNCHALTKTWRGRNKQNKRLRVSDESLFNALMINNWNMRQALIEVGLTPKGGNYKRCHSIKREYFCET
jgi:hypothetical protein